MESGVAKHLEGLSSPSSQPSRQPIRKPSNQPIRDPSSQASRQPRNRPTQQPSEPTSQPSRPQSKGFLFLDVLFHLSILFQHILVYYAGQNYTISYNGNYYSTLADINYASTYLYNCQSYYMALPSGWVIAPDTYDSRYVLGLYYWGTSYMVLANGNMYRTFYAYLVGYGYLY